MNTLFINKLLRYKYTLVIFIWVLLTAFNLTKAFHIDDTFHIEAAECIQNHPLSPMSCEVNWGNESTPLYSHNQPPLFFYLIALIQFLFGSSEIVMHLLLSVFTLLSLFYFSKLSLLLKVKQENLLLVIFAFCPAFIVNQNLMTDVPILALSLGSMFFLLQGLQNGNSSSFVKSALLLSCGLLIKYSLLPLFFVLLLSLLFSKYYKKAVVLLIPISTLILWSVWNVIEFDFMHIISRPRSGIDVGKIVAFFGTLGSLSIFSLVYLYSYFSHKLTKQIISFVFIAFVLSVPFVYFDAINEVVFNRILNVLFVINGLLLITFIVFRVVNRLIENKKNYFNSLDFPIALYIIGFVAFISVLAPFNATRHILLLIPFLLLFGRDYFAKSVGIINKLILLSTIALGVLLGVSDWVYADFYRISARKIEISDQNVWSLGHWGWQWYSEEAGMKVYSVLDEFNVRNGDLIVYPQDVPRQSLPDELKIEEVNFITSKSSALTFFSGNTFASMYNSFIDKPAWSLSKMPVDTIFIYRVIGEIGTEDVMSRIREDNGWLQDIQKQFSGSNIPLDSMLRLAAEDYISQKRK